MVAVCSPLHPENAEELRFVTLSGIETDVRAVQPENADEEIFRSVEGRTKFPSEVALENALVPIVSNPSLNVAVFKAGQLQNA